MKPVASSPFAVDPRESTVANRMYAMYAILRSHEVAQSRACALSLSDGAKRDFYMASWDCGTAACAAGSAGLTQWFQELARVKGVSVRPAPQRYNAKLGMVEPSNFVDNGAIWEYAHDDMHALFLGIQKRYNGIPGVRMTTHPKVNLHALTAHQVKEALRRIIIKYFGNKGAERCKELDKNCILTD